MADHALNLLHNQTVINWCYEPATKYSLVNSSNSKLLKPENLKEQNWARSILGGIGNQWSTILCQEIARETLVALGRKNVRYSTPMKSSIRSKKYQPDLECDDYVYEVKGRSWTTTGTAGEKILGVPLKYGELPRLYKKPLKIILVGYQEYEARNGYGFGDLLNPADQTVELRNSLEFFTDQEIEYVGLTDLLCILNLHSNHSKIE